MFLIDIAEEEIALYKKKIDENPSAKTFYESLDDFLIVFSFDKATSFLLYEAIDAKKGIYHSLKVSNDRKIKNVMGKEDIYSSCLACYIHEKEKKMTDEEIKKKYALYYDDIASLASLSSEYVLLRNKYLPLVKKLSEQLIQTEEDTIIKTPEKIDLSYFLGKNEDEYSLRIKVGIHNRQYFAKSTPQFLQSLKTKGRIAFYKDVLSLSMENIRDEDKEIIAFLQGCLLFHEEKEDVALPMSKKEVVAFLFLMKGREVHLDEKLYLIEKEEEKVTVQVDEEGNLSLVPQLKGILLSEKSQAILIQENERSIHLISFRNEREAILSSFIQNHSDFPYSLFVKEISEDILPCLEEVNGKEEYQKKHKIRQCEIKYFITYLEEDVLSFSTEFYSDGNKVSLEEFKTLPIGEKKVENFLSALSFFELPENGKFESQERILSFLKEDLYPLKKTCSLYLSENLVHRKVNGVGNIRIQLKNNIDWLDMDFGSDRFSKDEMEKILSAYREKKKYVRMKDSFISFEEKDSLSFKKIADEFSLTSLTKERLPLYEALKLSTYQSDEVSLLYSKEVKDLFDEIKNFKNQEIPLSSFLKENIRPYQEDGIKWLYTLSKHNLSGVLADDMGLGKTLQIIALLSLCKEEKPILIVTPKALIYNWENEFARWDKSQKVYVFDGNKTTRETLLSEIDPNKKEVFIISYDSLRNDLDEFEKYAFSYLILDEGQNISNVYAKKTKAVKEIYAEHKFVLTGTPIMNSLADLWSIFDFLMPGYLMGYSSFKEIYGKLSIDDPYQKQDLMNKIAPFVLKRKKEDVLKDLPKKEEQVLTINLNEKQRDLYDAYIQKARNSLDMNTNKISILAQITRLREICVDPNMFLTDFPSVGEKLLSCLEMTKSAILNGHKVLIFSFFAKTLEHMKEILKENQIESYLITGETSAKERLIQGEAFNTKDDISVMLVSLKAGGTGLNLVGADIVIHLDPWWNLAAEDQATDRAHRIGQKRNVTVFKLISKDTIEERVIQLQQKKKDLSSVIQEGDSAIMNINTEDLRFLLS